MLTLMLFLFMQAPKKDGAATNTHSLVPCSGFSRNICTPVSDEFFVKQWFRQQELARALTTRILTDGEMKEVLEIGPDIFVYPGFPYYEKDVNDKFINALAIQTQLVALQNAKLAGKEKEPCHSR